MKKILLIDDDEVFGKILNDSLPSTDYVVTQVLNGEEGLAHIKTDVPDLIILDMMMPKMNGMQFLEALKKENPQSKIPILISSELSTTQNVSDAITTGMSIGVKGYISKSTQNIGMIVKIIENNLR